MNIIWDDTFDIDAYYGCRTVATVDPAGKVEKGLCKVEITNTDRTGCDRDTPFFKNAADVAGSKTGAHMKLE